MGVNLCNNASFAHTTSWTDNEFFSSNGSLEYNDHPTAATRSGDDTHVLMPIILSWPIKSCFYLRKPQGPENEKKMQAFACNIIVELHVICNMQMQKP